MFNYKAKKNRRLDAYNVLEQEQKPKATFAEIAAKKAKTPKEKRKKLESLIEACADGKCKPTAKDVKKLDMTGVDAKGLKLELLGEDALREINFKNADLTGQKFRKMNLRGMKLAGALLFRAVFDKCNLENANMKGAITGLTRFKNCNMTGADMTGLVMKHDTAMTNTGTKGAELSNSDVARGRKLNMDRVRPRGAALSIEQYAVLKDLKATAGCERPEPKAYKHQFPVPNAA